MRARRSEVLFDMAARDVSRARSRSFAQQLQAEVAGGRPFECLISGDDRLRELNARFRAKDYATDVLSFPADGEHALGSLAISLERAREQAGEFGHDAETELRILMLHGVLHLLGFDHEQDRGEMAEAERRWRARFHLPCGLIERAHR